MAPLEPYEKIYVDPSFINTTHGEIACETCHGGNPREPNWQIAHQGIVKDPTFPDADSACGECHEEIVATAKNSAALVAPYSSMTLFLPFFLVQEQLIFF